RSHDVHRVTHAVGSCRHGLTHFYNTGRHGVHQRIHLITLIEEDFPAHGWNAEGVSIVSNPTNHAAQQPLGTWMVDVPKSQGVQLSNGTSAHGKNISIDPPYSGCSALVRL